MNTVYKIFSIAGPSVALAAGLVWARINHLNHNHRRAR